MGVGYWQSHPMRGNNRPSPREVLSQNVRALMSANPDLGTIKKVADASGSALSNGKVGRICAASHTTDIDTLQHLADLFGLEPWQLLVESLNPQALPRLADATVLNQILDAVSRPVTRNLGQTLPITPAHPLETKAAPQLAPALQRAMKVKGAKKDESGKAVRVPKSGTRRRA
jgi:hypothetical protein